MYAHECGAYRSQRRTSNPLELELKAVVSDPKWVLGTHKQCVLLTAKPSLQPQMMF